MAGYALVNKTPKVTFHCWWTHSEFLFISIPIRMPGPPLCSTARPQPAEIIISQCQTGMGFRVQLCTANIPWKFPFESSAPRVTGTVTSSAQARFFSSACKDCGEISHWKRNENKNSKLKSGTLCCCVRPRGCHPLRRASKTESVIASYLSPVKIFVVTLSAGEGDDAAGREKIGR